MINPTAVLILFSWFRIHPSRATVNELEMKENTENLNVVSNLNTTNNAPHARLGIFQIKQKEGFLYKLVLHNCNCLFNVFFAKYYKRITVYMYTLLMTYYFTLLKGPIQRIWMEPTELTPRHLSLILTTTLLIADFCRFEKNWDDLKSKHQYVYHISFCSKLIIATLCIINLFIF